MMDRQGDRWMNDVGAEASAQNTPCETATFAATFADSLVNHNWIRTEVEDELWNYERLVNHPEI